MKQMRKILAVLLALVMTMTVFCITAFAAQKKQYTAYTFFGDSVTAASGIPAYYEYFKPNPETGKIEGSAEGQRVRNSYPDLVAAGVGINNGLENYYNESHSGWRTSEVRQILDDTYVNDDGEVALALSRAMANGKTITDPEELRGQVREEIAKSDLITLDLGSNDIQLPIIMTLYSVLNPTASPEYKAWMIEKLLNEYGSSNELIDQLAKAVVALHGVEFAIEQIGKATLTGLHKFRVNYPVIINKIRELNPTADIYVIGLYNPLSDTLVSKDLPIPIGKVLDPMILSMNLYLSTLNPAKRQYTYVDAFNTAVIGTIHVADLLSSETGLSAEGMGTYTLYVHPSEEGHAYIAEQVLKAIPDIEEMPPADEPAPDEYTTPDNENVKDGLVKLDNGRWALYRDDKFQKNYTGFVKNDKGWWRVKNGYVDFNANSIYKNPDNGVWYKTTNGYVSFDETGVFKNENGWWRVENSRVNFNAQGIYKNENGWWKTTNGKVTFKENGVFKNENGWWKVEKSKVNFNFTGIASNQNGSWYIENGKVNFQKNGKVTYNGKTYTIVNGKVS